MFLLVLTKLSLYLIFLQVHRATSGTFSEDEEESPHTSENEKHAKELVKYRDKIKSIVDNWMGHYRESIGIALPNRLLSSSRKSPSDKSFSSRDVLSHARGRLVQSSVGFYPGESFGTHRLCTLEDPIFPTVLIVYKRPLYKGHNLLSISVACEIPIYTDMLCYAWVIAFSIPPLKEFEIVIMG